MKSAAGSRDQLDQLDSSGSTKLGPMMFVGRQDHVQDGDFGGERAEEQVQRCSALRRKSSQIGWWRQGKKVYSVHQ